MNKLFVKKNYLLIGFFLIVLLFSIIQYELINNSQFTSLDNFYESLNCKDTKSDILKNIEFDKYSVEFKKNEISIFPEVKNIFCIGRISYVDLNTNRIHMFYERPIIHAYQASSRIFSYFLNIVFIPVLIILLIKKIKPSRITYYLLSFSINLCLLFVSFENTNLINLLSISVPYFLLYELFNKEEPVFLKKINNFIYKDEYRFIRKKFVLLSLSILYIPVFLDISNTRYTIGYYFINYNHGLISKGFLGNIFFNLPINNQFKILLVNIFMMIIYFSIIFFTVKIFTARNRITSHISCFIHQHF